MAQQATHGTTSVELLTKEQVAKILQTSTRTVYRRAQEGVLPKPVKIGSVSRWRRYEIEQWIQDGCQSVQ